MLYRTVFSTRSTTTLHFVCSTKEAYVLMAMVPYDGAECTKPATIEGVVYVKSTTVNPHRHRHIEGYCNEVPKGHIRVGFWIGKCESYSQAGGGLTGWNSMSRIVIEEVPPPQA